MVGVCGLGLKPNKSSSSILARSWQTWTLENHHWILFPTQTSLSILVYPEQGEWSSSPWISQKYDKSVAAIKHIIFFLYIISDITIFQASKRHISSWAKESETSEALRPVSWENTQIPDCQCFWAIYRKHLFFEGNDMICQTFLVGYMILWGLSQATIRITLIHHVAKHLWRAVVICWFSEMYQF